MSYDYTLVCHCSGSKATHLSEGFQWAGVSAVGFYITETGQKEGTSHFLGKITIKIPEEFC